MRRKLLAGVWFCALSIVVAARAEVSIMPLDGDSPAAGGVPTIGDLQSDFEDGRYTICEQKIGRILSANPPPSSADRYTLLSLKGECLLQQKQGLIAAEAFESAAQAAPEKADAALAYATDLLIKRSANYAYKPLTAKDHTPLPIQNKAKRGPALAAMFSDELARLHGGYDAALAQTDARNVLDIAPAIVGLAKLELGATTANSQTAAMEKNLAQHIRDLLNATMKSMNTDIDAICADATKMVDVQAIDNRPAFRRRRGLTEADRGKLKDMLASCDKILAVIKDAGTGLTEVGADGFKAETTTEVALQNRIHAVVMGNFRPPPKLVTAPQGKPG